MLSVVGSFENELGGSTFKLEDIEIMKLFNDYNTLSNEDKISFAMFILDVFKQELELLNKEAGLPKVEVVELSEDMKSVGLIVNCLTDILTERFGYDVAEDLMKRINETETVD